MNAFLIFSHVSFAYDGAIDPLFVDIDLTFPAVWTAIAGANGCGKSTLLQLAAGLRMPSTGRVSTPASAVYCEQRTDDPPLGLDDFLASFDGDAISLRHRLAIDVDWPRRWSTLSHGERKRAQIAVALWRRPAVLAVDEPTNHLDSYARALLANALRAYSGIGLLVSHDRDLMDDLCAQTLLLGAGDLTLRPGGYSTASTSARGEEDAVRDEYRHKKREAQRLAAEAARRRAEADRADSRRSKRHLDLCDHDGRSKIDGAIVSGADGRAGRLARQLQGRVDDARQQLSSLQLTRRYEVGFWLPDSRADRPVLLSIPAGAVDIAGRALTHPDLTIERDSRIAVTGVNGSGKSTLIRHIVDILPLPQDRFIYLPQEIDAATSAEIMRDVNSLPRERLGQVLAIVSRLGSRPQRLAGNVDISPGELRKVLLALGIVRGPWLIVMDEPTNHLDLPAVEALENALVDCPCALLLVSHDARFLDRLTSTEWHISGSMLTIDGKERSMSTS